MAARENYRKLAVDKALEYARTCEVKQLSVPEYKDLVQFIYDFLTNKTNGKRQVH